MPVQAVCLSAKNSKKGLSRFCSSLLLKLLHAGSAKWQAPGGLGCESVHQRNPRLWQTCYRLLSCCRQLVAAGAWDASDGHLSSQASLKLLHRSEKAPSPQRRSQTAVRCYYYCSLHPSTRLPDSCQATATRRKRFLLLKLHELSPRDSG